ncbi:hypothetical protein [Haliangium ochraceum]|uniref:Uncharacterized protein n=1 Tax=Haliangium ochraceum (strain DSM 14365 / JCM 11303 / SMP-2) TaxID=502025 RepID=D0LV84_HALO1|nr:hypothetical protein [Haliangium ochraceum]ACY15925.1 hypothetical protein Hoch_3423 [Haliangium ochraceum DSM 14365]
MTVPPWLTFLVAGMVIMFGITRLVLAIRGDKLGPQRTVPRKGLYGLSRRRHFLYGIIYLVLGGILVAGALGYSVLPPIG